MRPLNRDYRSATQQSPVVRAGDVAAAADSNASTNSAHRQHHEEEGDYLFELAPLGTEDILARCQEGPGNWWGDFDDDCLRVDDRGRVVLMDPEIYFEVKICWSERKAVQRQTKRNIVCSETKIHFTVGTAN